MNIISLQNHAVFLWRNAQYFHCRIMYISLHLHLHLQFPCLEWWRALGFKLFRCASISWFQVVSKWVIDVFFTASASTGLLELYKDAVQLSLFEMMVSNCPLCYDSVKLLAESNCPLLYWWCQIVLFCMMVSNCLQCQILSAFNKCS